MQGLSEREGAFLGHVLRLVTSVYCRTQRLQHRWRRKSRLGSAYIGPAWVSSQGAAQSRSVRRRMGALSQLLRDDCSRDVAPVIWVRCAPAAGAMKESFRGRPVRAGLLRRGMPQRRAPHPW